MLSAVYLCISHQPYVLVVISYYDKLCYIHHICISDLICAYFHVRCMFPNQQKRDRSCCRKHLFYVLIIYCIQRFKYLVLTFYMPTYPVIRAHNLHVGKSLPHQKIRCCISCKPWLAAQPNEIADEIGILNRQKHISNYESY